ncbi:MAG: mechanosensitive ion channel [Symploca sp. SIO1B1]|nr:mechanosensitive ion channel [Symploca sp. SIO1C2]NER47090.1 mechanosensitive ion channel [Symploca sp. SIO1A3]NER94830.1 mechanosensitive ion channel [Symploca sp. SIO1B1]
MNETWEGIVQIVGVGVPGSVHPILAQTDVFGSFLENIIAFLPNLLGAVLFLLLGIIVAVAVANLIEGLLSRTRIDNKIANWLTAAQEGVEPPKIEKWISGGVFWLIIIFTVVGVLQRLQLEAVSEPLNSFLNQILSFLPQVLGAAILLGVAWLIASLVKLVTTRSLRVFRLDERLGQQVESPSDGSEGTSTSTTTPPANQFSLSDTIGNALYWFIFLLFLPSILSTLGLQGTLEPVQQLLNEILAALPNILKAIVIGGAGWVVAQVVRRIVTGLLSAAGFNRLGSQFGLQTTTGGKSLSWIIGTIVYVLILIPTAIAALNALEIQAISEPAIAMLDQILSAIPKIATAVVILIIAYVIGQFVSELITNILTSIGFNNLFQWLGLTSPRTSATPADEESEMPEPSTGQETVLQPSSVTTRTPSELVGVIALVAIMLFAVVAATDILEIEPLTAIVTGIMVIAGQILGGLVVFAIGLSLASFTFKLVSSSGSNQSVFLGQAARIVIIAFSAAIALEQMGIGGDIVNLAFGLLLGAIAVAIALAFGLGSRDIAADQVREWLASFKGRQDD